MSVEIMGSDTTLVTAEEAATIHGLHVSTIHNWSRCGLLAGDYPKGRLGGKYFRRTDVMDLLHLKEGELSSLQKNLPQMALQGIVASRRCEKRLNEIVQYLGLVEDPLGTTKDDVVTLFAKVQEFLEAPRVKSPEAAIDWARVLLGVTEDYLGLVALYVGEKEPWQAFMDLGHALSERCSPGTSARTYVDHARRSLRNAAYFYLRGSKGAGVAGKAFPGERFSSRILRRLLPGL